MGHGHQSTVVHLPLALIARQYCLTPRLQNLQSKLQNMSNLFTQHTIYHEALVKLIAYLSYHRPKLTVLSLFVD